MYKPGTELHGRSSDFNYYFHQVVRPIDLGNAKNLPEGMVLIGFESDEGVRRNEGRLGAKKGPNAIFKSLGNLAIHWDPSAIPIYHAGYVKCEGENLEDASKELQEQIAHILSEGHFPIALGGGHEISYPHMSAARDHAKGSFGIINLDTHFDLRTYEEGQHSGSWARQVFDDDPNNFDYLPIGINPTVNHRGMFDWMKSRDQDLILLEDLQEGLSEEIINRLDMFLAKIDCVGLTLDLDVMSAAYAPGVSAIAPFGITPQLSWEIIAHILKSGKVLSVDIAELNPKHDDGRTAKLAAQIIWKVIMELQG